jgi:esterase/lipase superfamily enzyme
MNKETSSWYSQSLGKEMPIATYGHHGFALLLVPTAAADYLEYERFQLIDAIAPFIDSDKIKVFSIDSINNESWLNQEMQGEQKILRHNQFNQYVFDQVIPYIKTNTSDETPVICSGASFRALHAMNLFLKRPDLINGTISTSEVYDLTECSKGYFNEDVYFSSPIHYISNLTDEWYVSRIRKGWIIIATGSGACEDPQANKRFSAVLHKKGIPHEMDLWGTDITHDWPTCRKMLPHFPGPGF